MKNIPTDLENSFKTLLDQEYVSRQSQIEYQQWFRYYLYFCLKYNFDQSEPDSLAHFIDKAKNKNQTAQQQSHATQAIQLYYRLNAESAHTFQHSFASHLLQANYDVRTIQELLGHNDVRTTMIHGHTVKSKTRKEAKSPLDF